MPSTIEMDTPEPLLTRVARVARRAGLGGAVAASGELADRLFTGLDRPPFGVAVEGRRLSGFRHHRAFLRGVAAGGYEAFTRSLFVDALAPGAVVVDAGAYIGLFTLLAAPRVGAEGRVLSFEPDPYNHRALAYNVRANGLANVRVRHAAVSDAPGRAVLFSNLRSTVSSSLFHRAGSDAVGGHEVEVAALDAELAGVDPERLVVKMDIEGAEPLALKGAEGILRRAGSVSMIVEIHPVALHSGGAGPDELIAYLRDLGFEVRWIDDAAGRLREVDGHRFEGPTNLFCVKRQAGRP